MSKSTFIIAAIVVVLVFAAIAIYPRLSSKPGELDGFVSCLSEKGAKFYGAFWCPHCQAQKKLFGSSADKLPYIECSTPDGKNRTQICIDNNIEGYPTWEFSDGERMTGEVSLARLSEKTSCALPQ